MNQVKSLKKEITKEKALELCQLKGSELMNLFSVANTIREIHCGNEIDYCTITNAKSGNCSEDCKFCTQSTYYETTSPRYAMKKNDVLMDEYKSALKNGATQFGFVSSGKALRKNTDDFRSLQNFLQSVEEEVENQVELCASVGMLGEEELEELKKSGLYRLHHNLQTSEKSYKDLVSTTHKYQEKISTIKSAKELGMKVCSGGIIGMGETWEDRIDMAFTLKELDVDSVPLNILNPIQGTPMGDRPLLSPVDFLKTIAIYRLILKDKKIKVGAGRENILKDFMGMAFMCGANSLFIGGYLTKAGRAIEDDLKFVEEVKKMWSE